MDTAIHYLHRFRGEYAKWHDVRVAIAWSHASTGRALYFTGVTIILGFSVLFFSNFVPTVMFGVLTAIAMGLALLANLTIMPSLLVLVHGRSAQTRSGTPVVPEHAFVHAQAESGCR